MAINSSLDSIRMQDVYKYYKSKSALENISLEIIRGETLVLLGPNGSGKSTLLKLLATLFCCDLGEISIFGKDIDQDKIEIQRNTGVLFDSIIHFDKLTGYENAWFFARSYGLKPKEAEERIQYLFNRFNIWNNRNQAVYTYSYGMKRKLAIIEAMIHEPEVIILDEPSMGLDYTSRLVLYDILQNELENTTIILATNDVDEATIMAQKIALLHKGQLLTIGLPRDLTSSVMDLSRIDLKLSSPLPLNELNDVKGVKYTEINESQNEDFQIQFLVNSKEETLANIVNKVVELGGKVKSIDTHETTLKDVFLKYIERSGSENHAA